MSEQAEPTDETQADLEEQYRKTFVEPRDPYDQPPPTPPT